MSGPTELQEQARTLCEEIDAGCPGEFEIPRDLLYKADPSADDMLAIADFLERAAASLRAPASPTGLWERAIWWAADTEIMSDRAAVALSVLLAAALVALLWLLSS